METPSPWRSANIQTLSTGHKFQQGGISSPFWPLWSEVRIERFEALAEPGMAPGRVRAGAMLRRWGCPT